MKMAVLLSGSGRTLDNFHERIENGTMQGEIVAVISNVKDVLGLEKAEKYGYPAFHAVGNEATNKIITEYGVELVLLAGFLKLYEPPAALTHNVLNIHPSLLPKYKGTNTHQRVLDNNETEHGVSIHIVTPELDDGPILMQGRYAVEDGDTAEDLRKRGLELEHQMYPRIIQLIEEGELQITALNGPIQFN